MKDILRYYPAGTRLDWKGTEWRIPGTMARKAFAKLLETPGEWVKAKDMHATLWPAMVPDYPNQSIANALRPVAAFLLNTSAKLEQAGKEGTEAAYRILGNIHIMQAEAGHCPCCGRPTE